MQLFPVVLDDRGKARNRERRASWIRCWDAEARRQPGPPGPLGGGARSGPPSGRDLQGRGGVRAAAWPWLSGWVVSSLPGGGEGGEGGGGQ